MSLRLEAGFERLRDALAETFAQDVDFLPGVLVTVLDAKITANTAHARIVLSVFPETKVEEVKQLLDEQQRVIKQGLSERLRLRRMPRLHYVFDDTEAEAAIIEKHVRDFEQSQKNKKV